MSYCLADIKRAAKAPFTIIRANNEKAPLDFSPFMPTGCEFKNGLINMSHGDYIIEGHQHDGPLFDYKSSAGDMYGTIKAWTYSPADEWDHYERTFQKLEMRRPFAYIVFAGTFGQLLKYADENTAHGHVAFVRKYLRLHNRVPIVLAGNSYMAAEFVFNVCATWFWRDYSAGKCDPELKLTEE